MAILSLCLIAYAAYFFSTLKPTNPYKLKSEYEKLYMEDANEVNQSDFRYETDLYRQFGNRISDGSDMPQDNAQNNTVKTIGEPVSVEPSKQNSAELVADRYRDTKEIVEQNSATPSKISPEAFDTTVTNTVVTNTTVTNTTLATAKSSNLNFDLTEIYISKNNSRITVPVPANTNVRETKSTNTDGLSESASQTITFSFSVDDKDVSMTVVKVAQGCFNPLIAFAIPSGSGVEYRILYAQKEVSLANTYRAIIGLEEYGTYSRMAGYRGTSCVRSPVPTKIDIRTAGWKKGEKEEVMKFIEEILTKMTV